MNETRQSPGQDTEHTVSFPGQETAMPSTETSFAGELPEQEEDIYESYYNNRFD